MAWVFCGRKAEEDPCGWGRGGKSWRCWGPTRGQLGQPGNDCLCTHKGLSSPESLRCGRHSAAADSFRKKRREQPPLARVLAKRWGSTLCCLSWWRQLE